MANYTFTTTNPGVFTAPITLKMPRSWSWLPEEELHVAVEMALAVVGRRVLCHGKRRLRRGGVRSDAIRRNPGRYGVTGIAFTLRSAW